MDLTVIKPLQDRLEEHPVYAKVKDLDRLRVFMQYHVYSVWDFMSLLKALQREPAPAQTPWLPGRFSSAQRFINEIVLEEESDEAPPMAGAVRYLSHFEMYVESMKDVAAVPVFQFMWAFCECIKFWVHSFALVDMPSTCAQISIV